MAINTRRQIEINITIRIRSKMFLKKYPFKNISGFSFQEKMYPNIFVQIPCYKSVPYCLALIIEVYGSEI